MAAKVRRRSWNTTESPCDKRYPFDLADMRHARVSTSGLRHPLVPVSTKSWSPSLWLRSGRTAEPMACCSSRSTSKESGTRGTLGVASYATLQMCSTDSALGRTNALTNLRIVVGGGLWVEASWYRVVSAEGAEMPMAQRSAGCRLHVLSEEEVGQVLSEELDGRLQWLRVGPDPRDVARLDETADLFYDVDEPSRSMTGRAVWLHDYLRGTLAGGLHRPDEERQTCAMLGMTEVSYECLSGVAANVCSEDFWFEERARWAWPSVY